MSPAMPVSLSHGKQEHVYTLDEQQYSHLWDKLATRDLSEAARFAEAALITPAQVIIRMLGADWLLEPAKRSCTGPENRPQPDQRVILCLLHYLIEATGDELDKKLVPETALLGGDSFFHGGHALKRRPLLDKFGQNGPELLERAKTLGATIIADGPDTFSFWLVMLPKVPVQVTLNYGDNEFPPSLTFAFDTASPRHCGLSVLAFLVDLMSDLLVGGYCVGNGLACERP